MTNGLLSRAGAIRGIAVRARRAGARAGDEHGYSLIEVLLVMSMMAVVVGLLMSPLVESQRVTNRDVNYAFAQQNARTGLDSMVSQIRQATNILSSGANQVLMNVTLKGVSYEVLYDCTVTQSASYHECVRESAPAGQTPTTSSRQVVVANLLNGGTDATPVFTWSPTPDAPYYMTATVQVPASGGQSGGYINGLNHAIVFTDGALMRNLNVGN